MSFEITADDVRQRLKNFDPITDLSETRLNSPSYIPAGNAWAELTVAGRVIVEGSAQEAMIKAAAVAYVAMIVANEIPAEKFKFGPVESKSTPGADKKAALDALEKEIKRCLEVAGITRGRYGFKSAGGDDYHPAGVDRTQIDLSLIGAGGLGDWA